MYLHACYCVFPALVHALFACCDNVTSCALRSHEFDPWFNYRTTKVRVLCLFCFHKLFSTCWIAYACSDCRFAMLASMELLFKACPARIGRSSPHMGNV